MALKKSNLSPELKSKLRRAVLGEIDHKQPAPKSIVKPATSLITEKKIIKPQLKSLNKISSNLKPVKITMINESVKKPVAKKPVETKAKTAIKAVSKVKAKTKKTAKIKKPIVAKTIKAKQFEPEFIAETKPEASKPIYNKAVKAYKPDWEKPIVSNDSLESLFKTPKSNLNKKSSFFKKPIASKNDFSDIEPIVSETKKEKTKKEPHKWTFGSIIKAIGIIVVIFVVLLAFDVVGIYRFGFRDDLSYQTAKTLQLPAGSVNGQLISLTDYMSDLKLLNLPLSEKREGLIDYSVKPDIKDKIFYRLAALDIMSKKLADYNKSVSDADLDKQMSLLLQQTGGREQADKVVKNIYGLNLNQFREKILKSMLLRENLQQAIMSDDSLAINKTSKTKAEEVLRLVQAPKADFGSIAKQYTDDEASVNTGGDLGWVIKGQLDPQWESLIFKASSSTIIPQIVKSNFGYHVIKVEQKLIDPNTNTESVKLRHILIKVDIDTYIKSLLDGSNLVKYVN